MSVQDSPSEAEIVTPKTTKWGRGGNFSVEEDKLLVSAWLNISVDFEHGNEQSKGTFYTKIAKYFRDHKTDSTRSVVSLKSRWGVINRETYKFCEVFAKVEAKNQSGTSMIEQMKIDAKNLFKETYKYNFQFEHCWLLLKNLPKWALNKPKENSRKELPQTSDSIDQAKEKDVLLDDTMDFERPIVRKYEKANRKRKGSEKVVAEYFERK
ncbi:glutathione S-transferase T3 isoform X2 [Quercus suber]|uniref:glutathione S-transferase T3 isoform X2 n=1 Tax=Quercus suber TaxID=58331 RepID=UPI0032DEF347